MSLFFGGRNYLGCNITRTVSWDIGDHEISSSSSLIYFIHIHLQLINELGAVDARLAPEFHRLLAEEEKNKATSKPAEAKKARVSSKKAKVRWFFREPPFTGLTNILNMKSVADV